MAANRNQVEHAITETLNERQLTGGRQAVMDQLQELRRQNPRDWNENLRAYEQMTRHYAGLPQIQIMPDGSFELGAMRETAGVHPSLEGRQRQQRRPEAQRRGDRLPLPPMPPMAVQSPEVTVTAPASPVAQRRQELRAPHPAPASEAAQTFPDSNRAGMRAGGRVDSIARRANVISDW